MIKKITLIYYLVYCMMFLVEKKGAPEYKDSEKETRDTD